MDIQLEKINLIKMIQDTDDISVITSIKNFFKTEKKDWWDELSEDQKAEIQEGIKDADEGRVIPFESFMQKYL
jgi:hypothetical protein